MSGGVIKKTVRKSYGARAVAGLCVMNTLIRCSAFLEFCTPNLVMKPHILISLLDNRASIQRRPREKAYKKMLSL